MGTDAAAPLRLLAARAHPTRGQGTQGTQPILQESEVAMLALLLSPAAAAPPPPGVVEALEGFVEAEAAALTGGLLDTHEAWLRTHDTCLPVALVGEGDDRVLAWAACGEPGWTCTATTPLSTVWPSVYSVRCSHPDGRRQAGGGGHSAHVQHRLVHHDQEAAAWAPVFSLDAGFQTHQWTVRPCTEHSAAHGEPSAQGPVQRCAVATGLHIHRLGPGRRAAPGDGVTTSSEPTDCSQPCSPPPDADRVAAAQAWLAGRTFRNSGPPNHALYATEAACRAAPPTTGAAPLDAPCEPVQEHNPAGSRALPAVQ